MTDKEILELANSKLPSIEISERLMEANVPIERYAKVIRRETKWIMIKAVGLGLIFIILVISATVYLIR